MKKLKTEKTEEQKLADLKKMETQFIRDVYGEEALIIIEEVKKERALNIKKESKTKIIDIHTAREVIDNARYKNSIDSCSVRDYVSKNIDFTITDEYWIAIDTAFANIWNNKLGIGGYFYWDEFSASIFAELQSRKMIMEFETLDKIVTLMLTYIQDNGGFME